MKRKSRLKLYVQYHGPLGLLMAVARSEEEAREYLRSIGNMKRGPNENYSEEQELEEHKIVAGLIIHHVL